MVILCKLKLRIEVKNITPGVIPSIYICLLQLFFEFLIGSSKAPETYSYRTLNDRLRLAHEQNLQILAIPDSILTTSYDEFAIGAISNEHT